MQATIDAAIEEAVEAAAYALRRYSVEIRKAKAQPSPGVHAPLGCVDWLREGDGPSRRPFSLPAEPPLHGQGRAVFQFGKANCSGARPEVSGAGFSPARRYRASDRGASSTPWSDVP